MSAHMWYVLLCLCSSVFNATTTHEIHDINCKQKKKQNKQQQQQQQSEIATCGILIAASVRIDK